MYVANNLGAYHKTSSSNNLFRWAIAGRSEAKLNRLRSRIIVGRTTPSTNDEIGVLTADAASSEDMNAIAKSTRVIVSAVGPYKLLGESIYAACVEQGTNYVDITGEVDWVARMREKYQKRAKETGSTLCSFAGYDCVPCDMTMFLARQALSKTDGSATIVNAETVSDLSIGGTMPRGTIRTSILMLPESLAFMRSLVRYSSDPDTQRKTAWALLRWLLPKWSPDTGAFTLPHFMGWCNIPVIYSSHAPLMDCTYHDRMTVPYSRNCAATGYGLLQTLMLYSFFLFMAPWFFGFQILVMAFPSVAKLLLKIFDSLQYRGSTQSNQQQLKDAITSVRTYATSSSGSKAKVHLRVKGDPGIMCTALLAVETAFSMLQLLDKNELPKGSIGSPSEIVGGALLERLQDEKTIGHSCTLKVIVQNAEVVNEASNKKKKAD